MSDLIGNSGVIKGMAVVANSTPAMNVYVQVGSAAIGTGTAPSNYSYFAKIDTTGQGEQVTIGTAAASPRIDYIVAYINKSQAGSIGVTNNTNNVFMLADVQGTPAGSPVVPTVAQIQSTIGAANPYIILAQVAVGASVSSITNANITDLRTFAKLGANNIDFTTLLPSLFTAFGANVQTYTNTGNGGGTGYYLNLGGIKLCWGLTGSFSTSGLPGSSATVSLPPSFFSNVRFTVHDVFGNTAFNTQLASASNTTTIAVYFSSGTGTTSIYWLVIGS